MLVFAATILSWQFQFMLIALPLPERASNYYSNIFPPSTREMTVDFQLLPYCTPNYLISTAHTLAIHHHTVALNTSALSCTREEHNKSKQVCRLHEDKHIQSR